MPQEPVDTVEIDNPNNPGHRLIINREDYDPDKHTLYEEPEAPTESQGAEESEEDEDEEDAS